MILKILSLTSASEQVIKLTSPLGLLINLTFIELKGAIPWNSWLVVSMKLYDFPFMDQNFNVLSFEVVMNDMFLFNIL